MTIQLISVMSLAWPKVKFIYEYIAVRFVARAATTPACYSLYYAIYYAPDPTSTYNTQQGVKHVVWCVIACGFGVDAVSRFVNGRNHQQRISSRYAYGFIVTIYIYRLDDAMHLHLKHLFATSNRTIERSI